MQQAAGDFVLGEGANATRKLAQRLWTGPRRFGLAVFLFAVVTGLWAIGWAGARYFAGRPLVQSGATLLLMSVYALSLAIIYGGWRQRAMKRIWLERGGSASRSSCSPS